MRIVIIDYGSGNLRSVAKALEKVTAEANVTVEVIADANALARADRIVLPGVGAFADCMRGLQAIPAMRESLETEVRRKSKPFLGICVGMQMMMHKSFEHGEHDGLGWLEGTVERIAPATARHKIPHMGWNELKLDAPSHPMLHGISNGAHAYFVHSYEVRCTNSKDQLAHTEYGHDITAVIAKDNMVGVQFHPEKSQETGLRFLANFIEWHP